MNDRDKNQERFRYDNQFYPPHFTHLNVANIHICFASDDRYAPHAAALVASIMSNKSPDEEISFHFFSDETAPWTQEAFRQMSREMGFHLSIYEVSSEQFDNLPVMPYMKQSRTTYLRLLMHRQLPDSLDKVLYLDVDMIVMSSLKELYLTDISAHYAAAVATPARIINPRFGHWYFNAGTILLNLKKYREEHMEEQAVKYARENVDRLTMADQDILNYIFKGNVVFLSQKWNARQRTMPWKATVHTHGIDSFPAGCIEEHREAESNPCIIHYHTQQKPWNPNYRYAWGEFYWKHLRKTPFYKEVLRRYYWSLPYYVPRMTIRFLLTPVRLLRDKLRSHWRQITSQSLTANSTEQ